MRPVTRARRQAKRVTFNVKFRGAGAATELVGRITDLSEVGLFLATATFIPLGKEVQTRGVSSPVHKAVGVQPGAAVFGGFAVSMQAKP